MTRIRVAIGEVQSALAEEILVEITHQQPDMEFVGQIENASLKDSLTKRNAEVLICEVGPTELPQVCRELFTDENPPLVVGLARGGRDATVCMASTGVEQLTSVIRTAVLSGNRSRNVFELVRPSELEASDEPVKPYSSNAEFIDDQLRSLKFAVLSEVAALEATLWHESASDYVEHNQGMVIK